jgi:hypothetical protein
MVEWLFNLSASQFLIIIVIVILILISCSSVITDYD